MFQLSAQKPYDMLLKHVAMEEYLDVSDSYKHAHYTTAPYSVISYCHFSLFGEIGMPDSHDEYKPRLILLLIRMFDHCDIPRGWMDDILACYESQAWDFEALMEIDDDNLANRLIESLVQLFDTFRVDFPNYFLVLSFSGLLSHLTDIFLAFGMSACFEVAVELSHEIQMTWSDHRMSVLTAEYQDEDNYEPQRYWKPYHEVMNRLGDRYEFNDYHYAHPFRGGGFSCII